MTGLRFELLGPVRAWYDDVEVDLGSPQQRAVLAALLTSQGRQVSLQGLIAALWDGDPPRSAVGSVRTYVFRLRRCLGKIADGGGSIQTAGDGYVLRPGTASLDLEVFERRTADARAARRQGNIEHALALLADALSLWQGEPLAGIPGPYAESQRARLDELHVAAAEERLELEIELGGHAAAVAELQALLTAHPLREKLSELLMLALYRSGRQADALAAFGDAQHRLAERLGVDPGPGLKEMHLRILRMDDGLMTAERTPSLRVSGAAMVRPAQLPADLAAFTGRREELSELNALLDAADVRTVVVSGMAGIGKTTLAVHWAHQVTDRFPDGQLYVNLRGFDPSGSESRPEEVLRGFVDALGVSPLLLPDGVEAQAALYRSLLSQRRVLVVLDNARDAEHVRPLLPGSASCVAVITSRNDLRPLIATHGARSLLLRSFSAGEAQEALTRRLGPDRTAAEPDAVAEIADLCGGLPLASAIVAARVTVRPDLPMAMVADELCDTRTRLDALSTHDAATDVRTVFSWSYRLLGEPARRLFRLLSGHCGPDISLSAAASMAMLPVRDLRPLLDDLAGARLLTEHRPGRYVFHDLIRLYAAELSAEFDTDAERGAALGRILDHYLHAAHAAAVRLQPEVVPPEPPGPRTGVTVEHIYDLRHAVAWFCAERHVLKDAISTAASAGFPAASWLLALMTQEFHQRYGHWHDWAEVMRIALDAAITTGDLAAQARVHRGLADACHFLGRDDDAIAELERAERLFTELGCTDGNAYVDSSFGMVLTSTGNYEEALEHCDRAYGRYVEADYKKGQARTLEQIGKCYALQHRHDEALRFINEALNLYQALNDRTGQAISWLALGKSQFALGDNEKAVDYLLRADGLFRELSRYGRPETLLRLGECQLATRSETLLRLGECQVATGHVRAAIAAWEGSLAIAEDLGLPYADSLRRRLDQIVRTSL